MDNRPDPAHSPPPLTHTDRCDGQTAGMILTDLQRLVRFKMATTKVNQQVVPTTYCRVRNLD